ncbi:MAG TPA: ABC transporter substrate-binding protein [Dehalococcoidia bacterium]|nr:ABC transporter substrate-binding protein [Dehalococcoidia bacterium]
MNNYWSNVLRSRVSRRRAMAATGATALGAAFLTACGGGDDSGGDNETNSVLPKQVDSTKQAVAGGEFHERIANDATYYLYDSNHNGSGNPGIAGWVYPHLTKAKVGNVDALPNGDVVGDFAESFEISPDGLKATFKIRPNMKWDPRAPTNGRIADSEDALWSYNHWAAGNARRQFLVNSISPDGPVLSVNTPDKNTFVMNLAFPWAPLMPLLAGNPFPSIMPREAESFDTRTTSRGIGAWIADEQEQSNFIRMKRNPDWYEKPRPLVDTYWFHVIPDYSAALAQFKAGKLDHFQPNQEDILATKKDVPSMVMGQAAKWRNNPGAWLFFGFKPDSPFRDERVRKALSMEIDRDLWLDVFSNRQKFEAEGLPVETTWYSWLGKGYPDIYLDPKKGELGEGSAFFKYDPAAAKKLLQAAGHNSPIKATWNVPDTNQGNMPEAIRAGIHDLKDFDLGNVSVTTYQPTFNTNIRESKGNFDGMAYVGWGENGDPEHTIGGIFAPNAAPNWQIGLGEDKELNRLVLGQVREIDRAKRVQMLKDVQKYLATKMYAFPTPGDYLPFRLYQPWVGNIGYFVSPIVHPVQENISQTELTYRWIDKSKKPA